MVDFRGSLHKEYRVHIPFEFGKLKQQAKIDDNAGGVDKFAFPVLVKIDLLKEASFKVSNGIASYSLAIKAGAALNISIQFNEFQLSENSILSIYTKNELTDSITAKENNKNKIWATRAYQGNTLQVVLKIPTKEIEQLSLKISTIYLGYKNYGVSPEFGTPGASNSCQPNVACPPGLSWENERNSVALINANGGWCSGTLVMNTCNTNIPYLLTAKHCVDQGGDISSWVFQFLYYSTDCSTNIGYREDIQINGCVLRSISDVSDFALVELNQLPPVNSGIHYAGWRSNVGFTNKTTMLHHPKGDVMKISVADGLPQPEVFGNAQCWKLNINVGGSQGGSSGAPYFNHEHKVIGQHFGVYAINESNPCHPEKFGGRFDQSWIGSGTNSTRLSNWLDPANSGAVTTNTTNIASLFSITDSHITGADIFCTGSSQYSLNTIPPGTTISWTSSNTSIATVTPTGNPATLTKTGDGVFILTAVITGTCLAVPNVTVTKTITIGSPNPFTLNATFSTESSSNLVLQDVNCLQPSFAFPNTFVGFVDISDQGVTSYNWTFESKNPSTAVVSLVPEPDTRHVRVSVRPHGASVRYRLTASNSCGSFSKIYKFLATNTGESCPQPLPPIDFVSSEQLSIAPNPVTGSINVTLNTENKNAGIQEIRIQNKHGLELKRQQFAGKNKSQSVNIQNLPTDVYVIQVFDGEKWVSEKIIKQ